MNLLFVIDDLVSGGAQRQMVNLACGLKSKGHNVELFTYYNRDHFRPLLDEAGIPVHIHLKPSRFSIAPLISLRNLIRRKSYDIVLAFLDTPNFYVEIACLGLAKKPKVVVSERSTYPSGTLSLKMRLLQECHRLAHAITVNSHHQRSRMEVRFKWMARKIHTIYNGLDLDVFSPAGFTSNTRELSLLAISSVSFSKNSLNLAKAVAICRDQFQLCVHIDWIGRHTIPGEGARPVQHTDEYLRNSCLISQWEWLGERTDIPQMLADHHALIHPSLFEGLPNVVCEALACGRPVLASNVCDHPRLVEEGVTGFLFDPTSPEDIAAKIALFCQQTIMQREDMGKAARQFAEQHLSLNRYVTQYETLFLSLI